MAASFIRAADDELSCPVCFEPFVDPHTPKNLPCGHVYCVLCLQEMVNGSKTCPECRKVIKIPKGGVALIPTNFKLRTLAEKHQKVGNVELPSNENVKNPVLSLCSTHKEEQCYYCNTCSMLACQTCLHTKHDGARHRTERLEEVYQEQQGQMKAKMEKATRSIEQTKEKMHRYQTLKEKAKESIMAEEEKIDACVESHINQLLQHSTELKVDLHKQLTEFDTKIANFEEKVQSAEDCYQGIERILENVPVNEYVIQHAYLADKLDKIEMEEAKTKLNDEYTFAKFVPNEASSKVGYILPAIQGRVRKLKLIQTLDGFDFADRLHCSSDGLLAVCDFQGKKVIIYHKVNGKYEKKVNLNLPPGNQSGLYDVAVCPDGRFMVARYTCIEVYSPDGNYLKNIKIVESGETNKVDRVKVTTDGRILAADSLRSLITEHDPTGNIVKTTHTSIKPAQMTLIHDTHIAISDHKTGKVIVIDIASGQETLSIDIPKVDGICYDEETECLLTARNEPADEPGKLLPSTGVIELYSYTTGKLVACLEQGLFHPMGMTLTADGNLIVANDDTVKIYEIK